jgi:threonine/homoserine/homoserine lactone efflux protein
MLHTMARQYSVVGAIFLLSLTPSLASSALSESLRHGRRQGARTLSAVTKAAGVACNSSVAADDLADFGQTVNVLGLVCILLDRQCIEAFLT